MQKAVIEEGIEGIQKTKGPRARQILRKRIANKYGLNVYVVQGIIGLGATQGIVRSSDNHGKRYEPVNYHELIGDLREQVGGPRREI
jgi:hypothetical protein